MVDKTLIFNIALDALALNYSTNNPDVDTNINVRRLRIFYPLALSATLADMDLNNTSTRQALELYANVTHPHYRYVYKKPSNCAKFRRIVSPTPIDNRETRIPAKTEVINGIDVICTNEPEAWAEMIPTDVNLSALSPSAALALGHNLAILASSLNTGKGAATLKQSIRQAYMLYVAEAQENDANENVDTTPAEFESEFIQARLGGGRWPLRT